MTSTYAILATVELLHEYYQDGRCPDFSIEPDTATAAAMRGAGILSRSLGNALILLVKVDDDGFIHRRLPALACLRFELNLEQPRMLNYTNLPVNEGYCYLFSNRFETASGTELHLNQDVPAYSTTADYPVGSLVAQGGAVHEAIRPVSQNDHAPGDADYWEARDLIQYVHNGDRLVRTDGRLLLAVAAGTTFSIRVFAFNPQSGGTDIPVADLSQSFEAAVTTIRLELPELPSGLYRIDVNGVDHEIYLDPEGTRRRSLGVIELWNNLDPAGAFSLADNTGRPKGARFLIRFANRLAIWKYRMRTDTATGITIPGQTEHVFVAGGAPREFISARPIPLRQQPIRNIQLMRGADILASRLANPPPERITQYSDAGVTWYCAEMRLNY